MGRQLSRSGAGYSWIRVVVGGASRAGALARSAFSRENYVCYDVPVSMRLWHVAQLHAVAPYRTRHRHRRPSVQQPRQRSLPAPTQPRKSKCPAFEPPLRPRNPTQHPTQQAGLTYWSPDVNPFRDPRWGRGQEVAGEDPTVLAAYARAFVTGLQQGEDPNPDRLKVVRFTFRREPHLRALQPRPPKKQTLTQTLHPLNPSLPAASTFCSFPAPNHTRSAKKTPHPGTSPPYRAYDLEDWNGTDRHHFDAIVSEADAANYYLPAFQACVEDANVSSLMCAYNSINGVPACASSHYMKDVARGLWGFNGYITSDCVRVSAPKLNPQN